MNSTRQQVAALQEKLIELERRLGAFRYRWWVWPLCAGVGFFLFATIADVFSPHTAHTPENSRYLGNAVILGTIISCFLYWVIIWVNRRRLLQARQSLRLSLIEAGADLREGSNVPVVLRPGSDEETRSNGEYRIFLVHGHDEGALNEVARYLESLNFSVIILKEEPSRGSTIIEKLFSYHDIQFAVVLLTRDDRGGMFDAPYEDQRPRARQNVVLELGFFLGRLGRDRVCVLHRGDVEIPSDYGGVLFVKLDETGGWKLALAGELRNAGLEVDLELLLQRVTG
jgi:hypothetical protein